MFRIDTDGRGSVYSCSGDPSDGRQTVLTFWSHFVVTSNHACGGVRRGPSVSPFSAVAARVTRRPGRCWPAIGESHAAGGLTQPYAEARRLLETAGYEVVDGHRATESVGLLWGRLREG
jgi:hypothetical protein